MSYTDLGKAAMFSVTAQETFNTWEGQSSAIKLAEIIDAHCTQCPE